MAQITNRVFNTAEALLAHDTSDFSTIQSKLIFPTTSYYSGIESCVKTQINQYCCSIISSVLSQLLLNSACFQATG